MSQANALLISDDRAVTAAFRRLAGASGVDLRVARGVEEAAKAIPKNHLDIVFLQLDSLPRYRPTDGENGLRVTQAPPTVAFSRQASIPQAVQAIRAGAADYMDGVPHEAEKFRRIVRSALESWPPNGSSNGCVSPIQCIPFDGYITSDHRVLSICRTLSRAADTDGAVVIEGERGTGKTLLARKMHEHSHRCFGPCKQIECGRTDGDLAAAGAGLWYSGAPDGTLVLEQVGQVPPEEISFLLRTLNQRVEQDGVGEELSGVKFRLVLTSREHIADRELHTVLSEFYPSRIDPVRVTLPALRDRPGDIPLLASEFLATYRSRYGRTVKGIAPPAMRTLVRYDWPKNVAELEDAIEHGVAFGQQEVVGVEDLPDPVVKGARSARSARSQSRITSLKASLRGPERKLIRRALTQMGGNKRATARKLGISRSTLYKKIDRHGLDDEAGGEEHDTGVPGRCITVLRSVDE